MVLSSRKVWVGSVALSSVLLLSSLPGVHMPVQAAEPVSGLKTVVLASNSQSGYSAQAVRKKIVITAATMQNQMDKPNLITLVAEAKQPVAKNEVKSETVQKPVQVASITTAPKQQLQVSRGSNTDASLLIRNAMSLQGTPYSFGGTSRSGFDCSGYTQYVFKGSGISLPRTSYAQFGIGSKVSREQLQPGDLVFFSTYSKGASHVGIYIGGGSFVHASNSGVRTTSLSDSYYASHYLGARRP